MSLGIVELALIAVFIAIPLAIIIAAVIFGAKIYNTLKSINHELKLARQHRSDEVEH